MKKFGQDCRRQTKLTVKPECSGEATPVPGLKAEDSLFIGEVFRR